MIGNKGQEGINKITFYVMIMISIGIILVVGISLLSDTQQTITKGVAIQQNLAVNITVYNSTWVSFNSDSDLESCSNVNIRKLSTDKLVTSEFVIR